MNFDIYITWNKLTLQRFNAFQLQYNDFSEFQIYGDMKNQEPFHLFMASSVNRLA